MCQSEGGRRVGRGETQTSGPSAPRPPMGSRGPAGMEGHTLPPGSALEQPLRGGVLLDAVCLGPTRKWGISRSHKPPGKPPFMSQFLGLVIMKMPEELV